MTATFDGAAPAAQARAGPAPVCAVGRVPTSAAVLTVALVGLVIWASLNPLNPDWLAYQVIYDDEGAWLSDQGRDPMFLMLVETARAFLGPDSYEGFRAVVGMYLAAFAGLLAFGRVLRPLDGDVSAWALIIVVTGFVMARFTIQIREGIAATLLVWALAMMINSALRRRSGSVAALLLLLAAALVHAGTAIYLAIAIVAIWLSSVERRDPGANGAWWLVWLLALAIVVTLPLLLSGPDDAAFLARSFGERVDEVVELNVERVLLQLAYLTAAWLVSLETNRIAKALPAGSLARAYIRLLGGPLLFCLIGLTFVSVLISAPSALIASYSRFVYLCIGLGLLVATFAGGRRVPLVAVSLFLIADQIRIVYVSASTLFDAAGL